MGFDLDHTLVRYRLQPLLSMIDRGFRSFLFQKLTERYTTTWSCFEGKTIEELPFDMGYCRRGLCLISTPGTCCRLASKAKSSWPSTDARDEPRSRLPRCTPQTPPGVGLGFSRAARNGKIFWCLVKPSASARSTVSSCVWISWMPQRITPCCGTTPRLATSPRSTTRARLIGPTFPRCVGLITLTFFVIRGNIFITARSSCRISTTCENKARSCFCVPTPILITVTFCCGFCCPRPRRGGRTTREIPPRCFARRCMCPRRRRTRCTGGICLT